MEKTETDIKIEEWVLFSTFLDVGITILGIISGIGKEGNLINNFVINNFGFFGLIIWNLIGICIICQFDNNNKIIYSFIRIYGFSTWLYPSYIYFSSK